MSKNIFTDEIDTTLYNFFEGNELINNEKINSIIKQNNISYDELKNRYIWLKEMNINPNIIKLSQNHKLIYRIFDEFNSMLNNNNIEYYYTSGILTYLLVNMELERYHHDLDIFVNMKDLEKLENICSNYNFSFDRKIGDRPDGTKRIMLKMYYNGIYEIPITVFMYIRNNDNSIVQNDYYIDLFKKCYVEKIYNSPAITELSFSDEPHFHNDIKYYSITLEALYLSKEGNRPKDIYDCKFIKDKVDINKLDSLKKEYTNCPDNLIINGEEDEYYDFIFSKYFNNNKEYIKNDRL